MGCSSSRTCPAIVRVLDSRLSRAMTIARMLEANSWKFRLCFVAGQTSLNLGLSRNQVLRQNVESIPTKAFLQGRSRTTNVSGDHCHRSVSFASRNELFAKPRNFKKLKCVISVAQSSPRTIVLRLFLEFSAVLRDEIEEPLKKSVQINFGTIARDAIHTMSIVKQLVLSPSELREVFFGYPCIMLLPLLIVDRVGVSLDVPLLFGG